MLFLLARVVKGSVRYNANGELNQSCDKRRYGTKPDIIEKNAYAISGLLITSECVITDKPANDKCNCGCGGAGANMPAGMGGGYGMDDFM